MKAAIYARVSTEEQVSNFSIENQLERLRKYCADKAYDIVQEYVDPGFSGTTLIRPALTRMIADAKAGLFDIVLVYKLDRLFRSNRHMHNTLAEWEESGIQVASVTESFDTTTAVGKAYLGMASTFAEWERNTFMERSRDGMRKAVQSGRYSGGIVAYGYQLDQDTKKLEIQDDEAKVIRQIYYWLTEERMTCYSIAPRLNALGIPTRYSKDRRGIRGKATANLWRPGRVYNMLTNTLYKGEWSYGKRSKRRQPLLTTVMVPAIVDADTFDRAQKRLKENNIWADRNSRRVYLLRGLIKCDICGHSYSGYHSHTSAHGERGYYRCNRNGNRGNLLSERCESPSVPSKLVEDVVWAKITEFVKHPETVKALVSRQMESSYPNDYQAEIVDAQKRLEGLLEAEKKLLKLYSGNVQFSEEAMQSELEEIARSRDNLKNHIRQLSQDQASEKERKDKLGNVEFILGQLSKGLETANVDKKRVVVENLLQQVRVGKDAKGDSLLRLVFVFEDPDSRAIENNTSGQLQSSRMPLRLLRRPCEAVHLLAHERLALPEAHQRASPRPHRHVRRRAPCGVREAYRPGLR